MYSHPDEAAAKGAAAREHILKHFTPEVVADSVMAAVQRIQRSLSERTRRNSSGRGAGSSSSGGSSGGSSTGGSSGGGSSGGGSSGGGRSGGSGGSSSGGSSSGGSSSNQEQEAPTGGIQRTRSDGRRSKQEQRVVTAVLSEASSLQCSGDNLRCNQGKQHAKQFNLSVGQDFVGAGSIQ